MAKILIPTPLRQFADKKDSVQLTGSTVGEVLKSLTSQYAELRRHLYNDEGKLRSFVNVYVNDEDIRYLNKEATPLNDGDTVSIVPSIAGGSVGVVAPPAPPATLSKDEILRYSRHLIMPEVGMEGQLKLKSAKVALIGTGGLGAPLGMYLAAAGIGRIGLVDFDVVDFTNLQRQVIHGTKDVGKKKLDSAAETMLDINPYVEIDRHEVALTSDNALQILKDYDIVVDGTDNFPTRYLVNDAAVLLGKTNVYASIFQFEGQVSVFNYRNAQGQLGPNYRDLYPTPPPPGLVPSCAEGGVLGVLPGIIGSLQALEVIKVITGVGEPLSGRFYIFDALNFESRTFTIRAREDNPINGKNPTITALIDYEQFCGMRAVEEKAMKEITVKELYDWQVKGEPFQLIDVREPHEYDIVNIGGTLFPLATVASHADEIDRDKKVVVHCKMGGRSAKAIHELEEKFGFTNLYNLKGGILAYIDNVQPELTKY